MDNWAMIGAMHEKLSQVQRTLRDHGEMLADIRAVLDRLQLKPPAKESGWPKLSIKMWLGLAAAGLSAAQALPLKDGLSILSRLL